jgi:hypothetical protein
MPDNSSLEQVRLRHASIHAFLDASAELFLKTAGEKLTPRPSASYASHGISQTGGAEGVQGCVRCARRHHNACGGMPIIMPMGVLWGRRKRSGNIFETCLQRKTYFERFPETFLKRV